VLQRDKIALFVFLNMTINVKNMSRGISRIYSLQTGTAISLLGQDLLSFSSLESRLLVDGTTDDPLLSI
jgi:hypothetical protein